ncbi:DUF1836 domain-containing protein [Anaerolentibacter hominis]|uniref:DUF1836 domain-containing protein n=1 Tax=Anaerolentibacter hominis TaxID=3079009 RepID=UPI0031B812E2
MESKSKDDYIYELIDYIRSMDYILPEDIPNIDLYMDQVTTFMDEHLQSSKRYMADKIMTKTMINNYTKNDLLPSPNKKKYSKEHILLLIFIYYFKNFLSISDIQSILEPLIKGFYNDMGEINLQSVYTEVFGLLHDNMNSLTKNVIRDLNKAKESFSQVENEAERDFLTNFAYICMLSFDVYVKKMMIEKLLDNSYPSSLKKAVPAERSSSKAQVKKEKPAQD